ncbi:MAG: hypothetical protein IH795_00760 [Bacteroidetes bacterium]|nr:hypothetical protein [Bacteroidota bacterium]
MKAPSDKELEKLAIKFFKNKDEDIGTDDLRDFGKKILKKFHVEPETLLQQFRKLPTDERMDLFEKFCWYCGEEAKFVNKCPAKVPRCNLKNL